MASSQHLPPPSKIVQTLQYFDKYDYPLTRQELIYWQSTQKPNPKLVKYETKQGYYFLPGREKLVVLRQEREQISKKKWEKARKVGEILSRFPFIQAVFITGSLAMNNAKEEDDIDLMLVTRANALWIARFFVVTYLKIFGYRRDVLVSEHFADKVCDNLWLDENNLKIAQHTLYMAHEVAQAKVLWDKSNLAKEFCICNVWLKQFLPNISMDEGVVKRRRVSTMWQPLNLLFFFLQYVLMKPRLTTERVAYGYAFFHPQSKFV